MGFVIYPATTVTGAPISIEPTAQMNDCKAIAILNDSSSGLNVVLPGNQQDWISPEQGKFFESDDFYGEAIKIFPVTVMTGTFAGLPQQITVLGYNSTEKYPSAGTTFDMSKIVVVSNTVNTNVANATSLTNTGYPPNNAVVYALPAGDGQVSGTVVITNSGEIDLGDGTYSGRVLLSGPTSTIANNVLYNGYILTNNAVQVFSVDSNGNLIIANGETEITYGSGNETHIINLQGSDIAFYQTDGTHQVGRIANNGNITAGAAGGTAGFIGNLLTLNSATLKKWSTFGSYGITNVMTYYNHNLGLVPDLVLLQLVGNNLGSVTYDDSTMTTTQVKIAGSVASGLFVRGLALKFS